jgi:hypothetical protein
VKVVDILGYQEKVASPFGFEPRKRLVGGIGFHAAKPCPSRIVEAVHKRRISAEGLGRRHILKWVNS